jgi:hypothetical protein
MTWRNVAMGVAGRATARAAVAVVVAACGLIGCGGSSTRHSTASSSSSSPSATGSSSSASSSASAAGTTTGSGSSTASPPPGATAKLTAPGSTLKLGQTAIVRYDTVLNNGKDGPSYKLALTIESITAGSLADFKGISLTGVPKHSTPTYVKLRMTNLGTHGLKTDSDDPADSVGAIEGNGLDGDLILTGYFPHCPLADTPNPFAAGQSFTTCETFMEPSVVTKIGYNGSESTIDSPVIWSR